MELPKYHESFIPILETLKSFDSLNSRELATIVRDKYYSGSPEELLTLKTSSGANVLLDRILWGKSYLKMGKFVSYPKRGLVQITDKGRKALEKGTLLLQDLQLDHDFINHRASVVIAKEDEVQVEKVEVENASPQDLIDSGFSPIEKERYTRNGLRWYKRDKNRTVRKTQRN